MLELLRDRQIDRQTEDEREEQCYLAVTFSGCSVITFPLLHHNLSHQLNRLYRAYRVYRVYRV